MREHALQILMALIAATPGILALMNRREAIKKQAQNTAKKVAIDEYGTLFGEARQQLVDCRMECNGLRERADRLEQALTTERIQRQKLQDEVERLEDVVKQMGEDLDAERRERQHHERVARELSRRFGDDPPRRGG